MVALTRDNLIDGLRELVAELTAAGQPSGIRIVGGAALSLRYFERRTTVDIDARIQPAEPTIEIAERIAARHDWPADWLNTKAAGFIPIARDAEWEAIYDDGTVSVWVASASALLAMKLRASRAGRDTDDIADLMAICGVHTIEAADEHFESFYPGEVLEPKAYRVLDAILARGVPPMPQAPPRADLTS
jgi:hypothetical protein